MNIKRFGLFVSIIALTILASCSPKMQPESTLTPKITSTPIQKSTATVISELDVDELESYQKTIEKYLPTVYTDQILKKIPDAQTILSGGEYNQSLSNKERETLAYAIVAVLENQRGIQPLSFESDGKTYFYNQELFQGWEEKPDSVNTREEATIQLYIPTYRNKETGNIMYYWNNRWNEAKNSKNIDFNHIITRENMNDGIIDFSNNDMSFPMENYDVVVVPVIVLDTTQMEVQGFPYKIRGKDGFLTAIDGLIIETNKNYAMNVKLITNGENTLCGPGDKGQVFSSIGHVVIDFDNLFESGSTYYVTAAVHFEQAIYDLHRAENLLDGYLESEDYLSDPISFWENKYDENYFPLRAINFYQN